MIIAIRTAPFALALLTAFPAVAQEAPTTPAEGSVTAPSTEPGVQWRLFSQSDTSSYLVDMSSITRTGDVATARVARVSKRLAPGDYRHVVDQFGIRCGAGETRVETSADVAEDGETADSYAADEPWSRAAPNSFDASVRDLACGEVEPNRPPFDTIRAWIDAGRP
jgi:hypothetical protein